MSGTSSDAVLQSPVTDVRFSCSLDESGTQTREEALEEEDSKGADLLQLLVSKENQENTFLVSLVACKGHFLHVAPHHSETK